MLESSDLERSISSVRVPAAFISLRLPAHRNDRNRMFAIAAIFLAAYALSVAFGPFPHPRFFVQPLNLEPALGVALLALVGIRGMPVLFVAALVANRQYGAVWQPESLLAAAGLTAVCWVGARALHERSRWVRAGVRPRDVHMLLVTGVAVALLCAGVQCLHLAAATDIAAGALPILSWRLFVSDLLGLVGVLPALLQWGGGAVRQGGDGRSAAILARDAFLFLASLSALLALVFWVQLIDEFRMSYLLFIPMIVVAMRYGVFGVASAVPWVQAGLLAALVLTKTRASAAFEFQLLVMTLAVAALYLGALSDERQRAMRRIAEHERDLRERGRALAEAQRIASTAELAAALAHELSQPLSALGTYARSCQVLAERGPAERDKLHETLARMVRECARAGGYLRRMRDFFSTGSLNPELVTAGALFEAVRAQIDDRLARARIEWHAQVEPGLPAVWVDAVQIGAVLGNLVNNACDALEGMAGQRVLRLQASRVQTEEGDRLRIRVQDNGPGLPPEVKGHLFSPMATSKPTGMGLGLALSRTIAERQGGRLWFDEAGAQTVFCLDLPFAAPGSVARP